jgi:hypothetical protein
MISEGTERRGECHVADERFQGQVPARVPGIRQFPECTRTDRQLNRSGAVPASRVGFVNQG